MYRLMCGICGLVTSLNTNCPYCGASSDDVELVSWVEVQEDEHDTE